MAWRSAFAGFAVIAILCGALPLLKCASAAVDSGGNLENVDVSVAEDVTTKNSQQLSCCEHRSNERKPLIFVSTLDGTISAIDASRDGGGEVWTLETDGEPLLTSTLGDIPFYVEEREYRLIPSLDGHFYVYNDAAVQSAPFDVDALLSGSLKLGADVLSGGKQVRTYIVNYSTGKLYQTCSTSGCDRFGDEAASSFPKLIIKRTTQTVRGIDPGSIEERWNVTVGEHELLLDDREDADDTSEYCVCLDADNRFSNGGQQTASETPRSYPQNDPMEDVDLKIIPPEGVLLAYDKRDPSLILWEKKLDSPIVQIWTLSASGELVERSIFDRALVPAFSYYSVINDPSSSKVASRAASGQTDRMIYIGTYYNQNYVVRSPEERRKIKNLRSHNEEPSRVYLLAPAGAGQLQLGADARLEGSCGNDCPTCASDEVNALILHNQYPRDMGWYLYKHKSSQLPRLESRTFSAGRSKQQRVADFLGSLSQTQFSVLVALALGFVFIPTSMLVHFYRRKLHELKAIACAPNHQSMEANSSSPTLSTPLAGVTPTLSNDSSTDFSGRSYGRYAGDFEPIRQLGRGGFGIVVESRNKHDDQLYAVKRIAFAIKKNAKERVRREVKALAQLDHPGVVRYFSAWFEEPPAGWQKEVDREMFQKCHRSLQDELSADDDVETRLINLGRSNGALVSSVRTDGCGRTGGTEEDDPASASFGSITAEKPAAGMHYKMWREASSDEPDRRAINLSSLLRPPQDSVEIIFAHSASAANAGQSNSGFVQRQKRKSSSSKTSSTKSEESGHKDSNGERAQAGTAYLYIQMQLCRGTLKDWLMDPVNRERDRSTVLDWFDQLICAMQYVHQLGLVHRDLKPSNIFFSTTGVLKIGDFGLATAATLPSVHSDDRLVARGATAGDNVDAVTSLADTVSPSGGTTDRVGTQLYMSPEQELGRKCTAKADIYALGLILMELLIPCKTLMERVKILQDARRHIFPGGFIVDCAEEHRLISQLLAVDPASRPTCLGIRQLDLFKQCWAVRPVAMQSDGGRHSSASLNAP